MSRPQAPVGNLRTMKPLLLVFLATNVASAQEKSAEPRHDMTQMRHAHLGGFMQGGVQHPTAKGVTLEAKVDVEANTITLRVGPMNLPADADYMKISQPPDLIWTVPTEGWLLAYHLRLVDANGNAVPRTVLHHTAFWNENRSDFLCPNKEEHIFGAGNEMMDWAELAGYGYRVQKGDKVRIETMMHNPTQTSYEKVYLEAIIPFQDARKNRNIKPRKNVYPAWMDVKSCGESAYNLLAGSSTMRGIVTVNYDGALLGVSGHMHDYARQIVLQDTTRKETVARLDAQLDAEGRLQEIPTTLFVQQGGYKLSAGDQLLISATYENPTGKTLRDGAMGIALGYFVAADDRRMAALRRPDLPAHDMAGMSHNQQDR